LVDNAVRHGALSEPDGKLEVFWKGRDEKGGFELYRREKGSPSTPVNPHEGFGAAIISGMVEQQLRGQLERESTLEGLQATIRVPGTADALRYV
jgi:two-component sensor histidine kinase